MSSKEIDTLRQKVYYIDTSVNTFFNRTLINIQKSLNDLNVRVSQLENQMSTTSEPNTNNSDVVEKKTSNKTLNKTSHKMNTSKNNNVNQIRTISLQ